MVLAISVAWVALLQKFSKPVVWATAIIKVVLWVVLGVWMIDLGSTETGTPYVALSCHTRTEPHTHTHTHMHTTHTEITPHI